LGIVIEKKHFKKRVRLERKNEACFCVNPQNLHIFWAVFSKNFRPNFSTLTIGISV